jgi:hypothetical protein
VRGLSALMILEQLIEAVDPDAPPKPCDYFDMIGGTVTKLSRYANSALT